MRPIDPFGSSVGGPGAAALLAGTVVTGPAAMPTDPLAAGGQGRVLINTSDAASVPNDGLRMNLTDFPSTIVPSDSSFQASIEEGIGAYQAVFGIFENTLTPPTAFFSVFANQTNQNVHLGYWTSLPLITGEAYDFELTRANGTNWTLTVNSALFGGNASTATFDFGAPDATWLTSISFSEVAIYASTSTVPAILNVPLAFALRRPGGWYLPTIARASYIGGGGSQWGVQGRLQRGTLAPGELETGSTVGNVTTGTALWTGGTVGTVVAITTPFPTVVGTSPLLVNVSVRTLAGSPLPSVTVFLADILHGTFAPTSVRTDPTGSGTTLFETPNVSQTASDRIRATVTLFGYVGSAYLALSLTPPQQVFLSADPAQPSTAPGRHVTVTFRATNATGAPVGGIQLTFAVEARTGTASAQPGYGSTGTDGTITVDVLVPSTSGSVALTARVDQVGAWGQSVVSIDVRPSPASPWADYGTAALEGLLSATLAALGVAVWTRSRRRRKAVPPMPLRRYLKEMQAQSPPVSGPPNINRKRP